MKYSKDLQVCVDQTLARQALPLAGLVVGTARAGRVEAAIHEHAQFAALQRVDQSTRFRYGSFTKVLVAALVCQLVNQGLLALDDEVSHHLPEFKLAGVSVRHLLSHTGGLVDLWQHADSPDEVMALTVAAGLRSEPGTLFSYSNPGYVVLGQLVKRLTGLAWMELLQKTWLRPLGIESISNESSPQAACATEFAFCQQKRSLEKGSLWADVGAGFDAAGGRLKGTAEDAALIASAIMTGLAPDSGVRLLSETMVKQMLAPQVQVPGSGLLASHWCLGWSLLTDRQSVTPVYGHFGGTSVIVAACPTRQATCAVLTNFPFGTRVGQDIVASCLQVDLVPRTDLVTAPSFDMALLAGRYRSETLDVHVHFENGSLTMSSPLDGQLLPLRYLHGTTFCLDLGELLVDAVFLPANDEGRPKVLHVALRALQRVDEEARP